MTQWNALLTALSRPLSNVSVTDEPISTDSVLELVESWVGRIVGYEPASERMDALLDFAMSKNGILTFVGQKNSCEKTVEKHLCQLVGLITTSDEFAYR